MSKKKILIADDEVDSREMLFQDLMKAGYEAYQAGDGYEAFILARQIKPDLIIADILMPKMSGNELIKKLHAIEGYQDIPFIILTARGLMRDYFEALKVARFINKPFKIVELLITIGKVLVEQDEKRAIKEWEDVAKQIATGIDKIYDPTSVNNEESDYKKILDEIIEWHLKEESPIDKMKDALW